MPENWAISRGRDSLVTLSRIEKKALEEYSTSALYFENGQKKGCEWSHSLWDLNYVSDSYHQYHQGKVDSIRPFLRLFQTQQIFEYKVR